MLLKPILLPLGLDYMYGTSNNISFSRYLSKITTCHFSECCATLMSLNEFLFGRMESKNGCLSYKGHTSLIYTMAISDFCNIFRNILLKCDISLKKKINSSVLFMYPSLSPLNLRNTDLNRPK